MKLLISRHMTSITSSSESAHWKIEDLIKFMKQEIESREMCHLVSNNLNDKRKSVDHHPNHFTASALFTGTGEYSHSTCIYCRRNHPSSKCDVVTDVTARKSILRRKGRCTLCLRTGHIIRKCDLKYKCVKCNGRLNVSICEPRPPTERSPENNRQQTRQVSSNVVSNKESTTFLQTAKAIITDVDKNVKGAV